MCLNLFVSSVHCVCLHTWLHTHLLSFSLASGPCMYALVFLDNVLFSSLQYGVHLHMLYLFATIV